MLAVLLKDWSTDESIYQKELINRTCMNIGMIRNGKPMHMTAFQCSGDDVSCLFIAKSSPEHPVPYYRSLNDDDEIEN